jgi:hypothetical protein
MNVSIWIQMFRSRNYFAAFDERRLYWKLSGKFSFIPYYWSNIVSTLYEAQVQLYSFRENTSLLKIAIQHNVHLYTFLNFETFLIGVYLMQQKDK